MNKGVAFTALSALLYGSIGYFGVKLLNLGLSLSSILFWRFLFSCLLLAPFVPLIISKRDLIQQKKSLLYIFILGIFFHASGVVLYFEASKSIGTGLAMVIFFVYPIFVVGLSFFLKRTPITRSTYVSLFLIAIGCVLIATGSKDDTHFDLRGLILSLCSGLSYGLYFFYSKEVSSSIPPVLSTLCVCLGTTCVFALYLLLFAEATSLPTGREVWILLISFAVVGTVLPVLFLFAGMEYLSASAASIVSVLEPIAVLSVGAVFLNEPVEAVQVLGATIIMSATILIYVKPRPKEQRLQP